MCLSNLLAHLVRLLCLGSLELPFPREEGVVGVGLTLVLEEVEAGVGGHLQGEEGVGEGVLPQSSLDWLVLHTDKAQGYRLQCTTIVPYGAAWKKTFLIGI